MSGNRQAQRAPVRAGLDVALWAFCGAAFGSLQGVLAQLLPADLPPWWVSTLVCAALAASRAPSVQLLVGGGRLEGRTGLRMTIAGVLFAAWSCTLGVPWLICSVLGVVTVVHLGWSGHRAGRVALAEGVALSALLQLAVHRGWVPSLVPAGTADVVAVVQLLFFVNLVVQLGMITRDRERAHAQLETERAQHTSQLLHAATHDRLTGLIDRAEVVRRLETAAAAAAPGAQVAVLYADLDGFKAVNDGFGHDAGDQVLLAVAGRLRSCLREGSCVARLGGDEFLLVVPGLPDADAARHVTARVEAAVSGDYDLPTGRARIGISVGVAVTAEPVPATRLITAADLAMYAVKDAHHRATQHRSAHGAAAPTR